MKQNLDCSISVMRLAKEMILKSISGKLPNYISVTSITFNGLPFENYFCIRNNYMMLNRFLFVCALCCFISLCACAQQKDSAIILNDSTQVIDSTKIIDS